ncbi:MAG TPA: hypothetical protein VFY89_05480 [Ktedonobacterales bacterium]
MLLLKACPRCRGDLVLETDDDLAYLACVQCGHILTDAEERALHLRAVRRGILRCLEGGRVALPFLPVDESLTSASLPEAGRG